MCHVADVDAVLVVACHVLHGKPVNHRFVLLPHAPSTQLERKRQQEGGQATTTHLSTKAVPHGAELLDALLLLQVLDRRLGDGVDGRGRVGVVAGRAPRHPLHEVEVAGAVQRDRVPVEQVDDQRRVPVGRELVGDQLAVLPDPDHVRQDQDRRPVVLRRRVRLRCREVRVPLAADFEGRADRCASVVVGKMWVSDIFFFFFLLLLVFGLICLLCGGGLCWCVSSLLENKKEKS